MTARTTGGFAHGAGQLQPGEWIACHHPERPHQQSWTVYYAGCPACRLAYLAAIANGLTPIVGDSGIDLRHPADPDGDLALTVPQVVDLIL